MGRIGGVVNDDPAVTLATALGLLRKVLALEVSDANPDHRQLCFDWSGTEDLTDDELALVEELGGRRQGWSL